MIIVIAIFLLCCSSTLAVDQLSADHTGLLTCRSCENAKTIDECGSEVCDSDQECFMDELITEDLTVIHNAGCRHKDVCKSFATEHSTVVGKRDSGLIACSRCCSDSDDCNTRLCGSSTLPYYSVKCYSCGVLPGQSQVENLEECATLTTCQSHEVCFAQSMAIGSTEKLIYGCKSKEWCQRSMNRTFASLEACEEDASLCEEVQRTAATTCQVCCADGGCNNGTCKDLTRHLYSLYKQHLFDIGSMKTIGEPTVVAPGTIGYPTTATPAL